MSKVTLAGLTKRLWIGFGVGLFFLIGGTLTKHLGNPHLLAFGDQCQLAGFLLLMFSAWLIHIADKLQAQTAKAASECAVMRRKTD